MSIFFFCLFCCFLFFFATLCGLWDYLRIQLEAILSPWFGVLLLELGLGSEKALAASGGRDSKSLLTPEEPWEAVTMATTISSAQIEPL